MNTLTHRFNFFTLPKLNTNLLSVLSLIVFCTMMFLTVVNTASAEDCDELLAIAIAAADAYADALENYQTAQEALQNALDARPINWDLIRSANEIFDAAEADLAVAELAHEITFAAYLACITKPPPPPGNVASGGCNSGSCDSGSTG